MIDWKRVVELHNEVGSAEFGPVLELFLDEIEEIVMRLSADLPTKLERDLHFLKGSAWNLGFTEFGDLCDACETSICRGRADRIRIDEIVTCYAISKQVFMRDLSRMIGDQPTGRTGVA